jgi:uroporphyrin-3 C-methyltransferase
VAAAAQGHRQDLDTLKALPQVDSAGVALKLETLIGRLDRCRWRGPPQGAAGARDEPRWLSALWLRFWAEFSQLVRIERMDRPIRRCWRRATRCSCAKTSSCAS